jgi:hypothetical protein
MARSRRLLVGLSPDDDDDIDDDMALLSSRGESAMSLPVVRGPGRERAIAKAYDRSAAIANECERGPPVCPETDIVSIPSCEDE